MNKIDKKKFSSSIEDYLESIYVLEQNNKIVRVRDISKSIKVSMPSVHQAVHILKKYGLVKHDNYGYVELTANGRNNGENIYLRHKMLIKFLNEILNVPMSVAERDACRIEHDISQVTVERLVAFIKFLENCHYSGKTDWPRSSSRLYEEKKKSKSCSINKKME